MSVFEDVAAKALISEMIAENLVRRDDGTLTVQIGSRTYMVEVRLLDVTE